MGDAADHQLHMLWPAGRQLDPEALRPPAGYRLRTADPSDVPRFRELMATVDLGTWGETELARVRGTILTDGWQVVVHEPTGVLVATGMAQRNGIDLYPHGHEVGWIAADPGHAGRRLGTVVTAAATSRLLAVGAECVFLRTDDFRLPAVKTYLALGFVPHLFAPRMPDRWAAVCERLGWPFTPAEWPA